MEDDQANWLYSHWPQLKSPSGTLSSFLPARGPGPAQTTEPAEGDFIGSKSFIQAALQSQRSWFPVRCLQRSWIPASTWTFSSTNVNTRRGLKPATWWSRVNYFQETWLHITTKLIDCNALKSLECGYSTVPTLACRNPIELQSHVATHSLQCITVCCTCTLKACGIYIPSRKKS